MIELRDYQSSAVAEIRDLFSSGTRRVLLVSPTGSGKTIMFSWICAATAARGKRVVILVHRQELVDQVSAALLAMQVEHGIIAAGYPATDAPVQVASVGTLARRLAAGLAPPDLIVVDEAHHGVAGSWRAILAASPDAFVLGVSATPERLDGQGLGTAFDAIVAGPSVAQLQEAGFLARALVYAPRDGIDLSGIRTRAGDFEVAGLAALMSDPDTIREALRAYLWHGRGQPAVAFGVNIAHSRLIAALAREAGLQAAHVDGRTPAEERRRLIAALGGGEIRILANAGLVSEGVDVPAVGAAILLRPTQSLALHLQQVGRILRPATGKNRAVVLDWAGNTLRHGLPDAARTWTLAGRPKRPASVAGPAPGAFLRHCPHCGCLNPPRVLSCNPCGQPLGPTAAERAAEEARRRAQIAERLRAMPYRQAVAWARTRDQLELVAAARGYRRGWIEFRLRDLAGTL